jgi:hypothetical protein
VCHSISTNYEDSEPLDDGALLDQVAMVDTHILAADAAQAKDMPYFLNSSRLTQLIA